MKQVLFILCMIFAAGLQAQQTQPAKAEATQAQPTPEVLDTFPVVLMFSECDICKPQTDLGFVVTRNEGTKEKPAFKLIGYLQSDRRPIGANTIVWMIHRKPQQ